MPNQRFDFPQDFLWGAATSAYQVEGAADEDGKGPSIWDTFCRRPGAIQRGETGAEACRHYRHWKEDLALMKDLGLNAYRFSVSWPRVQSEGRGRANEKGLAFYERLVDEMLRLGLRPNLTLYHWDLPQALEDKGGWTSRDTALAFQDYCALVARRLGDRVPMWATFNEPDCVSHAGYESGVQAPGRRESPQVVNQVVHHLLLAHGLGMQALRREARLKGLQAGIVLNPLVIWPTPGRPEDVAAAERHWRVANDWWLEPLLKGGYPEEVWGWMGKDVPRVEPGDLQTIRQDLDFLGLNLYTRARITAGASKDPLVPDYAPLPEGARCTSMPGWEIFPPIMESLLVEVTRRWGRLPLYVTENGASFSQDAPGPDGRVHDPARIDYLRDHLQHAHRALASGVDLRGYFAWSLMDNFEWSFGYAQRFGIVHVDFQTFRRTPKDSAHWLGRVARENGFEAEPLPPRPSPFVQARG